MATETFLNQHRQIRNLLQGMNECLEAEALRRDPTPAHDQVRRLGSYLRHHFNVERGDLYGRLLASSNPHAATVALYASRDLCGLEPKVDAFVRAWYAAGRIQRDPEGFAQEARELMAAVGRRIGQEERELFPLMPAI